jgi:eukaryotic-like serine/threonine-protein kinase
MTDQPINSQNNALLNGRYRLLAIVAGGGMATVYKAQDTLLNRVVAIKTLRERFAQDPQFVERFREEAQAAANLNHPNIVTIFDVGSDQVNGVQRYYIVMEFVEGQDLKATIRDRTISGQMFGIEEAVNIVRQISEGVGYAHRRGLVHCDLKPQNVIITPDNRAKVADFGIARAYTAMVAERVDVVWGTPQYYSPEQATGAAPTPASDVYSIGVMFFEMLSGRLPFESRDPRELARMHMTMEPPALHTLNPNVTLQLEAIVRRTLAKDPAARYRDADQLARVLAAYLQQGEELTLHQPFVAPVDQTGSRGPSTRSTSINRTSQTPQRPMVVPSTGSGRNAPVNSMTGATGATNATRVTGASTSVPAQQPGTDILLWLLAAFAILCILGLIPLWAMVVRTYSTPAPAAGSTTQAVSTTVNSTFRLLTSTLSPNQLVAVPQLTGLTLAQANQQLAGVGLQPRIVEERPDANATEGKVLEQNPTAGKQVAPGGYVELVVSKPEQTQVVPGELIGQLFTDGLSQTLHTVGWNVALVQEFNLQPEGTIVVLDPPAGTKLGISETLTVTVSTGGRINLNVNMSPIYIESARFGQDRYAAGQTLQFSVLWQAQRNVGKDYRVFVHLLRQDGSPVAGARTNGDRSPMNNGVTVPTSSWSVGTLVNDTYEISLPPDLPASVYRIEIGMYDDQARLRVIDYGNTPPQPEGINSVLVRLITVGQ